MTTYLYMVDSWDHPTHVQREEFDDKEFKRVFVDHMSTIEQPFMDRSEARLLCSVIKSGDTLYVYDWYMLHGLSDMFVTNRGFRVLDRYLRDRPPKGTKDLLTVALNHVGVTVAAGPKSTKTLPGWTMKAGKPCKDYKERVFARMLLSLITDYDFNIRDILKIVKDKNISNMIAAAKCGFPEEFVKDPMCRLEGHWMGKRRRAYWQILKTLGDRELTSVEMHEALIEAHVTFQSGRLFELRTAGAIEYSWSTDRRAYTYKRSYNCPDFHFNTLPYELLKAIEDEPKTAGELSKQFAEPRWYIVETFGCPSIRRYINITLDRRRKVHYQLKCKATRVDYVSVRDDLKLPSAYSLGDRTSQLLIHADDSVPYDHGDTSR